MDKQDSQTVMRVKYDVKKVETGETVNNCFVLRPDKDPAAVAALRTYAKVTPNKVLAGDIIAWVGAKPADKPLSEWTLGEVKAECAAHKNGCCGCKLCNSSFCTSPNGNPAEWVLFASTTASDDTPTNT